MNIKSLFVVALMALVGHSLNAQTNISAGLGKGIQVKTEDDSFYLKFKTRIQTRWDFENTLSQSFYDDEGVFHQDEAAIYENKGYVKRARLKFDGHVINKNIVYKIEYDVVSGYVRDALIKYKTGNWQFWFGQGKLPSNRERVVSSANLQLVDRSVFNKYYTLDRDMGLQVHHKFKIGEVVLIDRWAITTGSGITDNDFNKGISLTSKFEVLPFGEFTSKGDYSSADLVREKEPKIALAAYVNYNTNAYKDRGQVGSALNGSADLLNIGGDILYKHNGYSFMLEAGTRSVTDEGEFIYDGAGQVVDAFYTGYGLNAQTGYVFKNNWEVSGRYSFTKPNEIVFNNEITEYTLGLSKYVAGHSLKLQADVTYRERSFHQDMVIGRIQMEFQF